MFTLRQLRCGADCFSSTSMAMMNSCSHLTATGMEIECPQTAFSHPREFLGNRFVYALISSRAKGLSIGVNMVPAGQCAFDCVYCEIDREQPAWNTRIDLNILSAELEKTLNFVWSGDIRKHPVFCKLPGSLLHFRHVALSGDGEPTLSQQFLDSIQAVMHVRAKGREFFKVVLLTNGTGLDLPEVSEGLRCFTSSDEIWVKLDAGTSFYFKRINRPHVEFEKILSNILQLARQRPITIQSLFPSINGEEPPQLEIQQYAQRLAELKQAGARISMVQIYSADRPHLFHGAKCEHLPLKTLSSIARTVRERTGIYAEVF